MNSKKILFIIMFIVGLLFLGYIIENNESYQSALQEIKFEEEIELQVNDAYNERGIYILNDKYYISSSTFIIGKFNIRIKDDAIWRPTGNKHIPRISDIKAPFSIKKDKNNDTLTIVKNENKIFLFLSK